MAGTVFPPSFNFIWLATLWKEDSDNIPLSGKEVFLGEANSQGCRPRVRFKFIYRYPISNAAAQFITPSFP